jgi:hypothetical protein
MARCEVGRQRWIVAKRADQLFERGSGLVIGQQIPRHSTQAPAQDFGS